MGKILISLLVRRRTRVKHRAYRSDHVRKEDTSRDTAEPNDPVLGSIVVEILSSLERRQEDPLGGYVGVEDSRDDQGGKTESVGDPLDERSSATESGRGDILTTVVVDLEGKDGSALTDDANDCRGIFDSRQCRRQCKGQS